MACSLLAHWFVPVGFSYTPYCLLGIAKSWQNHGKLTM
nr:MAG TPA: hypothetical protein [Caudoviricetes sp.]